MISDVTNIIVAACNIALVIGVWVTYLSYRQSIKNYKQTQKVNKNNFNLSRIDKAIELTAFYKNNILKNYNPIRYIYVESGIYDILKKGSNYIKTDFNKNEIDKIYSKKDIENIDKIVDSDKFCEVATNAYILYGLKLHVLRFKDKDKEDINIDKTHLAEGIKSELIESTMNDLEYFSMYFTQGVAEEDAIYQSIHQTYLDIVDLLYYQLARYNVNDEDKYFTKTAELYKKWRDRKEGIIKNQSKVVTGTIVKKEDK